MIPGPDCGFWVGHFFTVFREPFLAPHMIWWKDIGYDAPLMRYSRIVGDNMIFILDPQIIREILLSPVSKDDCRFYKPYTSGPLKVILGNGLVTLEGQEWLKHRRLIQPAFSVSFLKEAIEQCVPDKVTALLQYWIDAGDRHEIDVSVHLSALTLDVIGDAGFAYDCHGLADIKAWSQLAKEKTSQGESISPSLTDPLITSLTAMMTPDLVRLLLFVFGLGKLDRYVNPRSRRGTMAFDVTIRDIIANAKEKENNSGNDKTRTKSLLQLLLTAKDTEIKDPKKASLSDAELMDEVKTFLFAGHETTAAWTTWAIFAMSQFPDVQEKLFQDVMKHAPKDTSTRISLEQVENMEYLAAFLQEILRLYSPVGLTIRRNRYEEKIAGYTIPKDTSLAIPARLIHRHPKHWEDPETFSPERWLNSTVTGIDNRGFTFMPFGAGGHNCIGYRFATYEAKLILAHMVRAVRVEIAPSQRDVEFTVTSTVTTKPKPRLKVVIKPRT